MSPALRRCGRDCFLCLRRGRHCCVLRNDMPGIICRCERSEAVCSATILYDAIVKSWAERGMAGNMV